MKTKQLIKQLKEFSNYGMRVTNLKDNSGFIWGDRNGEMVLINVKNCMKLLKQLEKAGFIFIE